MRVTSGTTGKARLRLGIFDGLRGHLLIGMLVAHLSFQAGLEWLGDFHHNVAILMYDAEFFVLIAGLLVGYLWSGVYNSTESRRKFITGRLITIYKYYILTALQFLATKLNDGGSLFGKATDAMSVLVMQNGGWFSDILPIYFFCFIVILPFFYITALGKPKLLFFTSLAIYVAAQLYGEAGFFGLSSSFVTFNIGSWQFLFVISILVGRHAIALHQIIRDARASRIYATLIGCLALTVLFREINFYPHFPDGHSPDELQVSRFGLHPVYLLRIILFSCAVTIILIRNDFVIRPLHKALNWYFGLKFLQNVGKYSIQMFTFHVYIMAFYKIFMHGTSDSTKSLFAVLAILIYISTPNLFEMRKNQRRRAQLKDGIGSAS